MNQKTFMTICIIAAAAIMLSGCMVGPDYTRSPTVADANDRFVYTGHHTEDADINNVGASARWWEKFGDTVTTDLVTQALNNNKDIEAAAARVMQAQAMLVAARGQQLPDISYNFSRARGKTSFNFGGAGRFSNLSTTFSQDITVSYIVDIFGKLKRSERAAWADMLASEANTQAVINAVIASVVKARADIATLQRQLDIARANTENWQSNLQLIDRRYNRGLVGPLDVHLARENLAASQAAEILVERILIQARNAMDVLLARRPGTTPPLAKTLPQLPDLQPFAVGAPAMLLDRRPDVRAAEFALKSTSEQIGVSIAQLYPDLTLRGAYGRNADIFDDIFIDETEIYSAVIRLAAPIYKGGQLRARVDFAKARYAELAANYAQTVLRAIREAEDALVNEQMLQLRLIALQTRFEEATAAEKIARDRYARGVERMIIVLETERRRRIAEDALNLIKGSLWNNRVDLLLALGGDWSADIKQTLN